MRKFASLTAALTILAGPSAAADDFWLRKREGWFWYEPIPVAEKQAADPRPPREAGPLPADPPPADPEVLAPATNKHGAAPLSHAWIKANLPLLEARAIDNPTPENVRAFYYVQRVMLDKSEAFASAAEIVVQGDPFIDETIRRPTATYAANAQTEHASAATTDLLAKIASAAGILFFFRSDCAPCHVLAPVLKRFADYYDFTVLPVSIDGRPLPNGIYSNYQIDAGQAAYMGVEVTPSLYLMAPGEGIAPISVGAVSFTDLHRRTLIAALTAGWINQQEFDSSSPVFRPHQSVLESLPDNEKLVDDPTRLVELIRDRMRTR